MTKPQQLTTRKLEAAEAEWLISFGWTPRGRSWCHPRLEAGLVYPHRDAVNQTHANPRLGWP